MLVQNRQSPTGTGKAGQAAPEQRHWRPSGLFRRRSGTSSRYVIRTMIVPAAWSNHASGAAAQRLSGAFTLAVRADPAGGWPREQTKPVAARAAGGSSCAETARADGALTSDDQRAILII